MRTGTCPNCQGTEIFEIEHDHHLLLTMASYATQTRYICLGCGLVETYIVEADLQVVRDHARQAT
jgi:hypothetical protein